MNAMKDKVLELHREGFPVSYITAWTGLPEDEVRRAIGAATEDGHGDERPQLASFCKLFDRGHRGFFRIGLTKLRTAAQRCARSEAPVLRLVPAARKSDAAPIGAHAGFGLCSVLAA